MTILARHRNRFFAQHSAAPAGEPESAALTGSRDVRDVKDSVSNEVLGSWVAAVDRAVRRAGGGK